MADANALGVLAALGSAAAWAIGAFLFKALGDSLSPLALTLSKGVCSVAMLGLACLATSTTVLDDRSLTLLAVSGLLGIALGDTFFFRALQDLSPLSLLVLAMLGQVLTVALAVLTLGEPLFAGAAVGIPLVLVGVVGVLRASPEEPGETSATKVRGILYGLLSVTCMAGSSVIAKAGLGEQSDTLQATFIRMLAGTLGVLMFGLATRSVAGWVQPFRDRRLLGRFALAVAVIAFGGFWLGMVAFKYTTVVVASTLTSTEPVFALLLTVLVLRQRVPWQAVLGTAITVAGVVLLVVPEAARFLGIYAPWMY